MPDDITQPIDDNAGEIVVESQTIQEATPEPEAQAEQPKETVAPSTNKRIRDILADRDYWKQQALQAQQVQESPAPKLEDFDHDIEQYTEAAVEHKAKQIANETTLQQSQAAETRATRELEEQFNQITAESAKQYPDFDKVFDANVPVSMQMAEALVISEKPTEIAYYLGTHRDEAAKIAGLPAHLQGYEIARLEARLSTAPLTSKAPPPPTRHVPGTNATGAKHYEDMSDEEFESVRRKEREAHRASMY